MCTLVNVEVLDRIVMMMKKPDVATTVASKGI